MSPLWHATCMWPNDQTQSFEVHALSDKDARIAVMRDMRAQFNVMGCIVDLRLISPNTHNHYTLRHAKKLT